jgi:sec-independent protein translocase protein TatC
MSILPELSAISGDAITPEEPGGRMSFFEHLVELRKRLINSVIAIVLGACIGIAVSEKFFAFVARPMQTALRNAHLSDKLVYTNPTGALNLLITLGLYIGLVLASPVVLYQVWLFIAPGLYKTEKKAALGFVVSSVFLFLCGISFGYVVILPNVLKFLISFQGPFQPLISINEYWDLILMVMLGLGVVFEMPILIFFLALFGIVTPKFLLHNFRYAMLIITVIAAVVTPTPDATTMLVFMAPMVVLYFVGILVAYFVVRNKKRAAEIAEGADSAGTQP